jgi:hypothetical protein
MVKCERIMMSQEESVYTVTDGEQHILVSGSREMLHLQLPKYKSEAHGKKK